MCLCVDRLSYDIAYWMKVSPNGAELYQVASETWFTEDGIAFGWDRTNQSWSVLPDRKCVLDDSLIYKPKVDFPIITDIRGLTRNQINRVVEAYEILGITRRRGDAVPDTAGFFPIKRSSKESSKGLCGKVFMTISLPIHTKVFSL